MGITGVELSELACEQFYQENNLEVSKVKTEQGSLYISPNPPVSIYQGDFFAVEPEFTGSIDFIYDRAALIALPEAMRKRYVEHLKRFMANGTRVLLFTLEYPQQELQGPPFSVSKSEIEELFVDFQINQRKQRDLIGNKFARRSLSVSSLVETAYLITA
ncbi:thiopurine S-methyltransferase [Thalassotalea sp. PS06]|uniref:thiopurine S-methyltransferase n=1 Tax=Thalassotalea sp. PS06 TaxID=2594005 RepID=UPI001165B747|nr:thiopurine S-methyltransferase [Thalassotalea sp. PS06]QDP01647.1 thiopurine S-methyltransferase [Thalassotalea sp. PS06]